MTPHEQTEGDTSARYLRADNPSPLRGTGATGEPLRWILEVHFVDRVAGFGGFQESILLETAELSLQATPPLAAAPLALPRKQD